MHTLSHSLQADLYEFTMAAGYFQNRVSERATFELFCFGQPPNRSYFLACGLNEILEYIQGLRFSRDDIAYLKNLPAFKFVKPSFFDYLKRFKFSGTVWAMPEGEVFFPNEPVIQVEAPIIEAQVLETYIMSVAHVSALVATKASRVVRAACGDSVPRDVIDFGSRRAHGPEAAVLAARAAYIGGCAGTSNLCAGKRFGIPVYGTMAHSWVQAFAREQEAFRGFSEVFPENTILLIDTYDTIACARKIAKCNFKNRIKAVRLDSGDLHGLSRKVRGILDNNGLRHVKIMASGNLNEYKIAALVKQKAPIDIFGVGTDMVTSRDMPALNLVYKLVQTENSKGSVRFRAKFSHGKKTMPARKQVFRRCDKRGFFEEDIIGIFCEKSPSNAEPLLRKMIEGGKLLSPLAGLKEVREYARQRLAQLPPACARVNSRTYLRTGYSDILKEFRNYTGLVPKRRLNT
ncbi:MAG: nicotinate phosphoribosyltransferase [Candidatus Omnitrophica bacterium]|nr:nicotinate phosphoribosyltransferase [Candidatus Omnitrophota bacterium]